jgi:3D (Asp-Asp-Asp) domain-containing protein
MAVRLLIGIPATCIVLAACGSGAPSRHASHAANDPARARLAASRQTLARTAALHAIAASCKRRGAPEQPVTRREWLSGFIVTEYYPVPERWFDGVSVRAPGSSGRHRVDWLYSANGVSMEGDGIDLAGNHVHIADLGSVGWVNAAGHTTAPPSCGIRWSHGPPAWRAGGWRNAAGAVTYPLARSGWSHGRGHFIGGSGGATFEPGQSLPLHYYRSVAVDPRLIPEGSRIYIPAYRHINGGWFLAQDTGGAIIGRHIDVYRPPTSETFGSGRLTLGERVYIIPPGG